MNAVVKRKKERTDQDYLGHYGLSHEPFAGDVEIFYQEKGRAQRLNLLIHLTQYSNLLLAITGDQGAGKSTLLKQFLKQAKPNWRLNVITAGKNTDRTQLLSAVIRGFGIEESDKTPENLLFNLYDYLDALRASNMVAFLIIDDAHLLDKACINLVLEIFKNTNNEDLKLLHTVLLGEPQLTPVLERLARKARLEIPPRILELLPFGRQQTEEYIRHRLNVAGLNDQGPFSPGIIKRIHRQSRGNPSQINALAGRILERADRFTLARDGGNKKLLLLFGAILIAIALAFQERINQWFQPGPDDLAQSQTGDDESVKWFPPEKSDDPMAELTEKTVATLELVRVDETGETGTTESEAIQQEFASTQATEEALESSDTPMPEENSKVENTPDRQPVTSVEVQPIITQAESLSETKTKPARAERGQGKGQRQNEEWIRDQPPLNYTVQILASSREQAIKKYLKENRLPDDHAYFYSLREGKGWYTLILGSYDDIPSAQAAIDALPPAIKSANPWIRRYRSVQDKLQ